MRVENTDGFMWRNAGPQLCYNTPGKSTDTPIKTAKTTSKGERNKWRR